MHQIFRRSAFFAAAIACFYSTASAVEIVMAPDGYVFSTAVNPNKGYRDIMLQTIMIKNDGDNPVTLTKLDISVVSIDGQSVVKSAPARRIIEETANYAGMAAQGFSVFLNAQILKESGIGAETTLARDATLSANEMALTASHYIAASFNPVSVTVAAHYRDENQRPQSTELTLPVRSHESPIDYLSPLTGTWIESGAPRLESHHRFIPSNEFARDYFKLGPYGALDRGDRTTAEDDYGFGEPVLSVANGEIVFVQDGETQDQSALSRRSDESVEEARARITAYQMRRFAENFRAAAAGNFIVIRHQKNDVVEYSSYGHLKPGSITVQVGDQVQQGEKIAEVGNTGDSTLTHLHFQVNAGADPFFSRSVPFKFSNGKSRYNGDETGKIVTFEN